jgi:hypothetical protein
VRALLLLCCWTTSHRTRRAGGDEVEVSGRVGGVAPLVEVSTEGLGLLLLVTGLPDTSNCLLLLLRSCLGAAHRALHCSSRSPPAPSMCSRTAAPTPTRSLPLTAAHPTTSKLPKSAAGRLWL